MNTAHPAPPFDVEVAAALAFIQPDLLGTVTPEGIKELRARPTIPLEEILTGRSIVHREETIRGRHGDLVLSIFQRVDHQPSGPGIFTIHGGGMILGDRFAGIEKVLDWVDCLDAVAVSIEYRLAPEYPDPVPVEDCYDGLLWMAENAHQLGFSPEALVIVGASAGGGLAAGAALLARDSGSPQLAAQMLLCPMLDDRAATVSSRQIEVATWDSESNDTGWSSLLGDRRGTDDVSIYAAPARATDLSGLPPTFIDVGSSDLFRDEDVAYASTLWASGGQCELHVWAGGCHGYEVHAPLAGVSIATQDARLSWLKRILGL